MGALVVPHGVYGELGRYAGHEATLLFLQEEEFHHGVGSGGGTRNNTGAAGRCYGQQVCVAYAVGRDSLPQFLPVRGGVATALEIAPVLPLASLKMRVCSFFFCCITAGTDGCVIDLLKNPHYGIEAPTVVSSLLNVDPYMVLADFDSYCDAHRKADALYADKETWGKMMVTNIAKAGIFASDRSIMDYAKNIWHTK